ncbi:MAG TPA: BRO family protein [Scandinavium sp.]|jgi:prophage antirepressor-like protein
MHKQKGEAQQCANTNWASIENNRVGNIDMNIVAKSEYNFHGVDLVPAPVKGGIWLTSSDIAKALGYASSKSVSNIYSRNSDEFTGSMSMVIKMVTKGINNDLREKSVRVFSLRGCHLIAMFATTDKAKSFRKWVLDVLDREVAEANVNPEFDFQMYSDMAKAAKFHMETIRLIWLEELKPGLEKMGSPLKGRLNDHIADAGAEISCIAGALGKVSKKGMKIH